jgi:glycerol kinase
MANDADGGQNVILVPAFTGLGAPYWNAECRGAAFGLSRATGPAEMARAALESVGFQTRDLLEAMNADWHSTTLRPTLRVDGGMTASDWTLQFIADITGAPVDRPHMAETTALGAAWLAGFQAGLYPSKEAFAASWAVERTFEPCMDNATRAERYAAWGRAVTATLGV